MTISRREFLGALGAAGALAATGGWRSAASAASAAGSGVKAVPLLTTATKGVPAPEASGIEHIVVVMMENRSFDHFMGWLPGSDGKQAGLSYSDQAGKTHKTHYLGTEYNGCSHPDPDHSYEGGRVQYDDGHMDGWLQKGSGDDDFALGYYLAADRPFMSSLATTYTACDRYFCSILAETYPNRFYMHAAQTDRLHNNGITSTTLYPTIWDRLQAKGVSHRYYFSDIPFIGLWGTKYASIAAPFEQFLVEAASGTLPAVSYVDPRFLAEGALVDVGPNDTGGGLSNDDHPHADIRAGDNFLATIFHTLANGAAWKNTVLVINYDEWGGFFDHVAPVRAAASSAVDKDVVNGKALLGFRVPCMVASPWTMGDPGAPRVYGTPQHQKIPFDHTSVLKLIEWRHDLKPLTARDASSDVGNLLDVLDFSAHDASVPSWIPLPPPPPPNPCGPTNPSPLRDNAWADLATSGLLKGWNLSTT
jgi:phospholipase C